MGRGAFVVLLLAASGCGGRTRSGAASDAAAPCRVGDVALWPGETIVVDAAAPDAGCVTRECECHADPFFPDAAPAVLCACAVK